MKAKELAARLMENPNAEVMVLDGFNGAGNPREINFGPIKHKITEEEAEESGDCEFKVGKRVIVIGYGCY